MTGSSTSRQALYWQAALGAALRSTAAARDVLPALRDHLAPGARRIASLSSVAQAGLLLATRIWLSHAVFVHGIMMMMQAEGFRQAPSGWGALLQGVLPALLVVGLLTRPVTLILLVGGSLAGLEPALHWPQRLLLIWLLAQGAGPLSLDFLMRGGLAQVPIWGIRAARRLYGIGQLTAEVLPFGTRICLAIAIAGGSGAARWPQPVSGDPLTAPWWLIVLSWSFMTGLLTQPVALLFCGVAPLASLAGTGQDIMGVMLLLLLMTVRGPGKVSLDWVMAQAAANGSAAAHVVADELPHGRQPGPRARSRREAAGLLCRSRDPGGGRRESRSAALPLPPLRQFGDHRPPRRRCAMRSWQRVNFALLAWLMATPAAAQSPLPGGMPPPRGMSLARSTAMRFPQPVRVGDLLHRLVLQPVESQNILGRVRAVVKTPHDGVMIVMNFGGFYGYGGRLIAVPIDAMVLLGQDMEVVAYTPKELARFPTFIPAGTTEVPGGAELVAGLAKPSH